jgi:hypothetical protein
MKNRRISSIGIAIIFFSCAVYGGAWTQKKGAYFLKVAGGYLSTSQEFNHKGDLQQIMADFGEVFQNSTYREWSVQTYAEYGLTDKVTLVLNVPFKVAINERVEISNYFPGGRRNATYRTTGFGDLWTSARLHLLRLPIVASVQTGVKIPLGYKDPDEITGPALGNGEVEYQASLLLGQGFHPLPIYVTGEIGYRIREGALHDEIVYSFEVGYTYNGGLLKVGVNGVENTATPPDVFGETIVLPLDGGGGETPDRLFGDHNFLKANVGFLYPIGNGLLLDGGVFHMLSGKNIVAGTLLQLGVVFSR